MMIDCNITISYCEDPGMATTNFKRSKEDVLFQDIGKVLKINGRYSNFIFKDNYRKSENYLPDVSNCIILDFDDGFTIDEFIDRIGCYAYAIGTTKSHNKEKNGKVCERFRVIIPTKTAISLNEKEYSEMMREVLNVFDGADQACSDAARAYSGYIDAEVIIQDGEYFQWEKYYAIAQARKEIRKREEEQKRLDRERNIAAFYGEGTKAEWYRENWLTDIMRLKLKVDERFVSGGRNNYLYSVARYLKDIELLDIEITDAIEWINGGELDDLEIKQILKGLRITQ